MYREQEGKGMEKENSVRKTSLLVRKEEEEEQWILVPSSDDVLVYTRNVKI